MSEAQRDGSGARINPASIPQHVVDAATYAYRDAKESRSYYDNPMPLAIAGALTVLMGDEQVGVTVHGLRQDAVYYVRPSDVLAAVLARDAT